MIEFGSWLSSALFGMVAFACLTLTLKQLTFTLPTPVILAYGFFISAILFLSQCFRQGASLRIGWNAFALIILSSVFGFLANMSDVNALRLAPNAGYATAIKAGQILIVTIIAFLLFPDQKISTQGVLGVVFIVLGIGLLALQK